MRNLLASYHLDGLLPCSSCVFEASRSVHWRQPYPGRIPSSAAREKRLGIPLWAKPEKTYPYASRPHAQHPLPQGRRASSLPTRRSPSRLSLLCWPPRQTRRFPRCPPVDASRRAEPAGLLACSAEAPAARTAAPFIGSPREQNLTGSLPRRRTASSISLRARPADILRYSAPSRVTLAAAVSQKPRASRASPRLPSFDRLPVQQSFHPYKACL